MDAERRMVSRPVRTLSVHTRRSVERVEQDGPRGARVLGHILPVERYRRVEHRLGRILPGQFEPNGPPGIPGLVVRVDDQLPGPVVHARVRLEHPVGLVRVVPDQGAGLASGGLGRPRTDVPVPVMVGDIVVAPGDHAVVRHHHGGGVDDRDFAVLQLEQSAPVDARSELVHLAPRLPHVPPVRAVERGIVHEVGVESRLRVRRDLTVAGIALCPRDAGGRALGDLAARGVDLPGVGPVVLGVDRVQLRRVGNVREADAGAVAGEVLEPEGSSDAGHHEGDGKDNPRPVLEQTLHC